MEQSLPLARVLSVMSQLKMNKIMLKKNGWSGTDLSTNMRLLDDGLKLHRNPVPGSTDCCRTKSGYSQDLHVWEITWPKGQRGTCASVGVSTEDSPVQDYGYKILVGHNNISWGWDINKLQLLHNSEVVFKYPNNPEFTIVPDTFHLVLDMDQGTLAFVADGKYLGVAFTNLKGTLYPIVSCVWGNGEIALKYSGGVSRKL